VFVTYPVYTLNQADAVKIATNLAKASGYKNIVFSKALHTGPSAWDIVLVVH
jgi:hypothetical protein